MAIPGVIRATAASFCGPTRSRNEDMAVLGGRCVRDAALATEWTAADAGRPFLAAVLDGLGGHQGGDLASAVAGERLAAGVWEWPADATVAELREGLEHLAEVMHEELGRLGEEDVERAGCGTTCTALAVSTLAMAILHIGDSRCYRRRDGVWVQVSEDHAIVIPDGQGGKISRLIYALGADLPELPPDLSDDLTDRCQPGDLFMLITDGVLAAAGSDERLLAAFDGATAQEVLDRALSNGQAPDNVTAVRIEFGAIAG